MTTDRIEPSAYMYVHSSYSTSPMDYNYSIGSISKLSVYYCLLEMKSKGLKQVTAPYI